MFDPVALKKAKNQALKYLSYRERSKREITQYLEKKNHSHLVIQQTLEYLENLDYIDDKRFALQWGQFKINQKKLGRNRLYLELLNKGIDQKILENILSTLYENNSEIQLARECAHKKWGTLKGIESEKKKRRLIQYLKRKGFSADIIYKLLLKFDMEINYAQTPSILSKD